MEDISADTSPRPEPVSIGDDGEALFVYGLLRLHRSGASAALDEAGVQRISGAVARATAPPSGVLKFDEDGDRDIPGELVLLPGPHAANLLARLDDYEAPDYERVVIGVQVSGSRRPAWVYQLRSSSATRDPEEMLNAACRKVEIAHYHFDQLRRWMAATPPEALREVPIPIQAHFEGILAAGYSALDEVAGFHGKRDAKRLFEMDPADEPFPAALRAWYDQPLIRHAGKLRNAATHRFYGKLPAGGEAVEGLRIPDLGFGGQVPSELMIYAAALLEQWDSLAAVVGCPVYRGAGWPTPAYAADS
ncbi:MAG: gamma-glutamylcyclotransferase [Chloroflexi bacterium]|nr:gamma-glutamylcyclotransferase [Chloroflexota bacterium]